MSALNLTEMSDITLHAYVGSLAQQVADLVVVGATFDEYDTATVDRYRTARDVLMDRLTRGGRS